MERSMRFLVEEAGSGTIWEFARQLQAQEDGISLDALDERMLSYLSVMRDSVADGMRRDLRSVSGMVGGMAPAYAEAVSSGHTAGGKLLGRAASMALAVAECNACMGRIVAAPTAGACGILPGVLLAVQEDRGLGDLEVARVMYTAAAVGRVIAEGASISGAEGGCQAECGSAAAMTAAALTELLGGSPSQAANAVSFALMSLLGLVCDPVGGLVEVPCVFRNATGASVALTSADLALAAVPFPIPADEMIEAMGRVGRQLPASLRETGLGGCAACPSVCSSTQPGS